MSANLATTEHVMPGLRGIHDRVLDALDDAPSGVLEGETAFVGRLATVQTLAAALRCSDSAARRAVHDLRVRGLVQVFDGLDPACGRRRLYITGQAVSQ